MDNLYMRILDLSAKKGDKNITETCKNAGISRAPLTDLKMGRSMTLSSSTISKLSDYFQVSTDYLL